MVWNFEDIAREVEAMQAELQAHEETLKRVETTIHTSNLPIEGLLEQKLGYIKDLILVEEMILILLQEKLHAYHNHRSYSF